jgi:hypothetical protein
MPEFYRKSVLCLQELNLGQLIYPVLGADVTPFQEKKVPILKKNHMSTTLKDEFPSDSDFTLPMNFRHILSFLLATGVYDVFQIVIMRCVSFFPGVISFVRRFIRICVC